MENDKPNFPQGIQFFKPSEKAPEFVLGNIVLKRSELTDWMNNEINDIIRLDVKVSQKGNTYLSINNYVKPEKPIDPETKEKPDSIPF